MAPCIPQSTTSSTNQNTSSSAAAAGNVGYQHQRALPSAHKSIAALTERKSNLLTFSIERPILYIAGINARSSMSVLHCFCRCKPASKQNDYERWVHSGLAAECWTRNRQGAGSTLQVTSSKFLTHCVLRPTQPPTLSGMGMSSSLPGVGYEVKA